MKYYYITSKNNHYLYAADKSETDMDIVTPSPDTKITDEEEDVSIENRTLRSNLIMSANADEDEDEGLCARVKDRSILVWGSICDHLSTYNCTFVYI